MNEEASAPDQDSCPRSGLSGRRALPASGPPAWLQPRWARTAVHLVYPRWPGSPRRPHTRHRGQAPAFLLVTEVAAAPAPLGTSAVMLWPRVHHPLSLQRPPMSTPRPLCGAPLVDTPQIPASVAAGPSTLGPRSLSRLCGRARPRLWEAPPWGPRRAEPPRAPAPPPRGPGLVPFCHVLSPHCLWSERPLFGTERFVTRAGGETACCHRNRWWEGAGPPRGVALQPVLAGPTTATARSPPSPPTGRLGGTEAVPWFLWNEARDGQGECRRPLASWPRS